MNTAKANNQFARLAWATFDTQDNCEKAIHLINDLTIDNFTLSAIKSQPRKKRIPVRISPPLPAIHIEFDYELCKLLISEVLDPEKEIESWIVPIVQDLKVNGNEAPTSLKLDLLLLYMRRVHAYSLYCGEEHEDERMLSTRCGPQHIRNSKQIDQAEFEEVCKTEMGSTREELIESFKKIRDIQAAESITWRGSLNFLSRYYDLAIKRLEKGPVPNIDPQKAFIEQDLEEFCKSRVQEEEKDKRYSCKFCKKMFTGQHFVINHIKNKHQEIIDEIYERKETQDWLEETIQDEMKRKMKSNYYKDENKFFDKPQRKYSSNETGYYSQMRDEEREKRLHGKKLKEYVDLDDPQVNANLQKKKNESREQMDYGELFGWLNLY